MDESLVPHGETYPRAIAPRTASVPAHLVGDRKLGVGAAEAGGQGLERRSDVHGARQAGLLGSGLEFTFGELAHASTGLAVEAELPISPDKAEADSAQAGAVIRDA